MAQMDYRGYVAYSSNDTSDGVLERLVNMYSVLLAALYRRYRSTAVTFVFEENEQLDGLYSSIWEQTIDAYDLGAPQVQLLIGHKDAPCLAVTDYVLGVVQAHVGSSSHPFEHRRFTTLAGKLAYLVDFDDDRHFGSRKRPIL
jgi:hypothetical protein